MTGALQHFHALSKTGIRPAAQPQPVEELFQLNDWLYYQLMRKVLDELYAAGAGVKRS